MYCGGNVLSQVVGIYSSVDASEFTTLIELYIIIHHPISILRLQIVVLVQLRSIIAIALLFRYLLMMQQHQIFSKFALFERDYPININGTCYHILSVIAPI